MASTTTTATQATADIDALLTTYLALLHTYTTLRSKLTTLQSSTSLSLARANFSNPQPLGYTSLGSNPKLRASVRLRVSPPSASLGGARGEGGEGERDEGDEVFALLPATVPASEPGKDESGKGEKGAEDAEADADSTTPDTDTDTAPTPPPQASATPPPPLPPGFGVLAPPSLREAQSTATEAVHIVTQMAGIEVRMRGVEVEVRRARKRERKAAAEKGGR